MALRTSTPISSSSHFHYSSSIHSPAYIQFTNYTFIQPTNRTISLRKRCFFLFPVPLKVLSTVSCKRYAKSTEETSVGDNDDDEDSGHDRYRNSDEFEKTVTGASRRNVSSLSDALNIGSRDPVYEVCFDFKYHVDSIVIQFSSNFPQCFNM